MHSSFICKEYALLGLHYCYIRPEFHLEFTCLPRTPVTIPDTPLFFYDWRITRRAPKFAYGNQCDLVIVFTFAGIKTISQCFMIDEIEKLTDIHVWLYIWSINQIFGINQFHFWRSFIFMMFLKLEPGHVLFVRESCQSTDFRTTAADFLDNIKIKYTKNEARFIKVSRPSFLPASSN